MINYRSTKDLNAAIMGNLSRLPRDIQLIVGIPRSGLLAANLLALHLNLPLTDLRGFIEERVIHSGQRGHRLQKLRYNPEKGRVLVIDDSVLTGGTMSRVRKLIEAEKPKSNVKYCAVFVSPRGRKSVDLYFEEIMGKRVFEWNIMHSWVIQESCVDIDGVLCADPTEEENDDGAKYLAFLQRTKPLQLPSVKINTLVTCRLEKYRRVTEMWLKRHGIEYERLIMMDLPSKEMRKALNGHGKFKANAYIGTKTILFIESSKKQAREIAILARRPVLCMETQEMLYPSVLRYAGSQAVKNPKYILSRMSRSAKRLSRHLLDIDPP
jgi:uncharacterized HAD superfamily protein/adenine/guanine phosphoribosyltransferase-like PRPP-binding protein